MSGKKSDAGNASMLATGARGRRNPVQERSAETVRKVRNATSRLLGRGLSVEALTTAQIAAEAGVSVGSVYRFFPDKQAIVDALAVERLGEFKNDLMRQVGPSIPKATGPKLLGDVVDAFMNFLDANPDFRTIAYGGRYISRGTRDAHSGAEAGATIFIKQYMVEVLGLSDTPRLRLRLRMAVEAGDRLIAYALEQTDPQQRRLIVEEAKLMLSTYLF